MRSALMLIAVALFFSISAHAKDLSGEYRLTSSICLDPKSGTSTKSTTGIDAGTESFVVITLKKSSDELSYEAGYHYWSGRSSAMKLAKIEGDNESYNGTWHGWTFSLISRGNKLIMMQPPMMEGQACPVNNVIIDTLEKVEKKKFLGIF